MLASQMFYIFGIVPFNFFSFIPTLQYKDICLFFYAEQRGTTLQNESFECHLKCLECNSLVIPATDVLWCKRPGLTLLTVNVPKAHQEE